MTWRRQEGEYFGVYGGPQVRAGNDSGQGECQRSDSSSLDLHRVEARTHVPSSSLAHPLPPVFGGLGNILKKATC